MADPPEQEDHVEHDPTGLGLARDIARTARGPARGRRARATRRQPTEPQLSGARPDDRDPKLLADAVDDSGA